MSMLCMYTAGRVMKAGQKNNGLSDKITYIHNMSGDNSNYKVYLGGVPYGQYSAVYKWTADQTGSEIIL